MRSRFLLTLSVSLLLTVPALAQQSHNVYLGDSYAWGYTVFGAPPTNGDQGYAALFTDYLASRNGGVRPVLNNLAVPGESTSSFFSGQTTVLPASQLIFDAPLRNQGYNTNYTVANTPQINLFNATVGSLPAGDTVDYVTVQIGGNDILGVVAQPNFLLLPGAEQTALLNSQFATLQTNYINLLTAIKIATPNARILTVGYADPFAGLGPANPLPISGFLTTTANSIIQAVSGGFGATYIDIFTPFVGNELEYTRIGTDDGGFPNVHPTPLGYQVIANQLISAVSPEPSALALLLPAFGGLLFLRRRR